MTAIHWLLFGSAGFPDVDLRRARRCGRKTRIRRTQAGEPWAARHRGNRRRRAPGAAGAARRVRRARAGVSGGSVAEPAGLAAFGRSGSAGARAMNCACWAWVPPVARPIPESAAPCRANRSAAERRACPPSCPPGPRRPRLLKKRPNQVWSVSRGSSGGDPTHFDVAFQIGDHLVRPLLGRSRPGRSTSTASRLRA